MKRHELEHLIRAAGAITGAEDIVVIGKAILATRPDSPPALLPLNDQEKCLVRERWERIVNG